MAQHGYLREGYGMEGDRDSGLGREGRERGWRERDDWREEDRGRGWMLGGGERDRFSGRDEDRGFFERMGDRARSWFDDDEEESGRGRTWRSRERGMSRYGPEHGYGGFQGDFGGGREQGGFGGSGDYREGRTSFSSHPDAHYLSWRQKQLEALDREYEEYCRECEQRFHQDFDSWRRNRQQGQQGQQSSEAQQGSGQGDELMLRNRVGQTTDTSLEPRETVDTASGATVGTTPETGGRGRR